MSGASDIAKLFEVAGGSPAQYQEVERTEQMQGARGRWSAHADAQPELDLPDAEVEVEAEADAAQPLIEWSIAAVTDEPPPVLPVAQEAPAIEDSAEAAADTPVEAEAQAEVQTAAADMAATPAAEIAAAPHGAALSSVFARLMARNEPRADAAPRVKS